MLKFIYLFTFLLAGFSQLGCSSLNEDPNALLVAEQFYANEGQAVAAINGSYRKLYESGQSLYNGLFQIGVEMATDDYEAGPRARNAHVRAISSLIHDASNDRMEQLWKQSYDAINSVNLNIFYIALMDESLIRADIKKRLLLEAKFLRALHYFNLVRWFGDVPLLLVPERSLSPAELYVTKSAESEVYAQIISDLSEAEELPNHKNFAEADVGRASSGAAKALLSKVYLTHGDWAAAKATAQDLIQQEGYALMPEFADVFAVDKKNGLEHIFSAQFKGRSGYQGNSLAGRSAPTDIPGINGDYADALHTEGGLYASYAENDKRRAITFTLGLQSPTDGNFYTLSKPQFHKYYDTSVIGSPSESAKNLPIIRYAEVLLIFAEADNELLGPSPEALAAINQVRERAGITALDIAGLTKDQFRELVFEERRKELVYEYQRWFDLVRRGADYYIEKLHAAGKNQAAARHLHFPTPQRELNLNPNLKQHPDWLNF